MTLAKRDRSSFKTCTTRSVRSATSPATISQSAGFEGWISSIFYLFTYTQAGGQKTAHNVLGDDCPAIINPFNTNFIRSLNLYNPLAPLSYIVTSPRN